VGLACSAPDDSSGSERSSRVSEKLDADMMDHRIRDTVVLRRLRRGKAGVYCVLNCGLEFTPSSFLTSRLDNQH